MSRRVVITGMGVVSPVGNGVGTFWKALCAGQSGIDRITAFDASEYPSKIAGEVRNVDFGLFVDAKEVRRTDRVILLGMAAADEAIKQSGIVAASVDLERVGTIVGSGIGGLATLEAEHTKLLERGPSRVSPFLIPMMIPDMTAGRISMQHGFKGPNYSVVSACASGAHAIGDAFMLIKFGMADAIVCGGTEAVITPTSFAGFCSMKALSTRNDQPQKASSPFDKKRDGFIMAEGAGIIVLESLEHALGRNATIYAEMTGYGASGDAHHLSAPAPEGAGAQIAMKMALATAGVKPSSIDYINAHGTSTELNDKFETYAIRKVFGDDAAGVAISSTKSMTGHLLGASGAIECIASVMAVRDGCVPPTINYEDPDPECDLEYTPNTARKKNIRYAMSNSFGFGGHNACLILGKYESPQAAR
ncbi:MAG: beta-ketoacyl-ACP synthase II [Chitinispirillaceae bacterium]|nr:beta-ketoacyl-ACP synthase II [Chitinispirillaceae bacterium]